MLRPINSQTVLRRGDRVQWHGAIQGTFIRKTSRAFYIQWDGWVGEIAQRADWVYKNVSLIIDPIDILIDEVG